MYSSAQQAEIRDDIFRWLSAKTAAGQYEFTRDELANYHFGETRIPLIDRGRGIRNPKDFDSTLSIMTSLKGPYDDEADNELFVRYDYRASESSESSDNLKLSRAHQNEDPLVYFKGIRPGVFVAHYPVFVVQDDPQSKKFVIALDESLRFFADPSNLSESERRYADRVVRSRLHQPAFRARVMHAYSSSCAVCSLKHPDLLDAAHILSDLHERGFARVSNGLALCKIHHAAYDRDLLGISPDYEVRINDDLLNEVDGPMLRHGLQDMHGRTLNVPKRRSEQPDKEALAERFVAFAA